MTAMMLTARDASTGSVLDITAMSPEQRDRVHGKRTARRHGYDIVCKQCDAPVFFVHNHHHTEFWRHGPEGAKGCIMAEISGGESAEHIGAKITIAQALRQLTDWTAELEKRFDADGDVSIVDVYAEHSKPASHQSSVAWEVQLAHQTHGDFTERTDRIRRTASVHTNWITPHDNELGLHQGIIINHAATLVVARLYEAPDEAAPPLPPMPLESFVKGVSARHPKLLWSASGENSRFIAFPRDSVNNTPGRPDQPKTPAPPADVTDRTCDRPPAQRHTFRRDDVRHVEGDHCDRCGLAVAGIDRGKLVDFRPRPCSHCPVGVESHYVQTWGIV